jgi:hypothetical protein
LALPARRHLLCLTAVLLSVTAGCSGASSHGGSTSSGGGTVTASRNPGGEIPVGPGPSRTYTVQPQPRAGSCHYSFVSGQPLPDPSCTPGALSPDVNQATLSTTICRKGGYTSGIRPPTRVTGQEKSANAKSYGYAGPLHEAEYDHLISLQLGGAPNDPRNLWVEPPSPGHKAGAGPNNPKDAVETHLHTAICKGKVTLAAAQRAIASDWATAESTLGLH